MAEAAMSEKSGVAVPDAMPETAPVAPAVKPPKAPKAVPSGRVGLEDAAAAVKGKAVKGKKRGRPSKEDKDAAEALRAGADYIADMSVKGIALSCQTLASRLDPKLPLVGAPKGATFALSEIEAKFCKEAFAESLKRMPDKLLAFLGPWIGPVIVIVGITAPRIAWVVRIRGLEPDAAVSGRVDNNSGDARKR